MNAVNVNEVIEAVKTAIDVHDNLYDVATQTEEKNEYACVCMMKKFLMETVKVGIELLSHNGVKYDEQEGAFYGKLVDGSDCEFDEPEDTPQEQEDAKHE